MGPFAAIEDGDYVGVEVLEEVGSCGLDWASVWDRRGWGENVEGGERCFD